MFVTASSSTFFGPSSDNSKQSGVDIDENDFTTATAMQSGPLKPHRAQQLLLQHRFQDGADHHHDRSYHNKSRGRGASRDVRSASNSRHGSGVNDDDLRLTLTQHQDQQILLKQQFLQSFVPKNRQQQKQTTTTFKNTQQLSHSSNHSAPGRIYDGGSPSSSSKQRRGSFDSTDSSVNSFTTEDGGTIDNSNNVSKQTLQEQEQRSKNASDHGCGSDVGSNSPSKHRSNNNNSDYKLKIANEVLLGSIAAVIDFLKVAGVSPASLEQLQKNVNMRRYYAVLSHAQAYVSCVPTTTTTAESGDEDESKMFLIISAWEALCDYKSIQYGRCCDHIYELQQEMNKTATPSSSSSSKNHNHHWNDDKDDDDIDTLYCRKQIHDMMDMQQQLADQCTKCLTKLQIVQAGITAK